MKKRTREELRDWYHRNKNKPWYRRWRREWYQQNRTACLYARKLQVPIAEARRLLGIAPAPLRGGRPTSQN